MAERSRTAPPKEQAPTAAQIGFSKAEQKRIAALERQKRRRNKELVQLNKEWSAFTKHLESNCGKVYFPRREGLFDIPFYRHLSNIGCCLWTIIETSKPEKLDLNNSQDSVFLLRLMSNEASDSKIEVVSVFSPEAKGSFFLSIDEKSRVLVDWLGHSWDPMWIQEYPEFDEHIERLSYKDQKTAFVSLDMRDLGLEERKRILEDRDRFRLWILNTALKKLPAPFACVPIMNPLVKQIVPDSKTCTVGMLIGTPEDLIRVGVPGHIFSRR